MKHKLSVIDRIFRYPVKSMRGEELRQAFVTASGLEGDHIRVLARSI